MWHVSASEWYDEERLPESTAAERLGQRLLRGAGGPQERIDYGPGVVHVRAALTDAEMALLPAEFLACPAVDIAGGESGIVRDRA